MLSSKVIDTSGNNFPYKILFTDMVVSIPYKAFANKESRLIITEEYTKLVGQKCLDLRELKKKLVSETPTLIISNGKKNIGQRVKYLEKSSLLTKRFTERIVNNTEEKSGAFLRMLLDAKMKHY